MNQKVLTKIDKSYNENGLHETFLNEVKVFKTTSYAPRQPLLYDLCLILVLQGKKIGHLANNTLEYDFKNYLVVPSTLPFECETIASEEEPFICMLISIDKKVMYELVEAISKDDSKVSNDTTLGVFSDNVTTEIEDVVLKLLTVLESKEETKILGAQVLRELYYRIAIGKNSQFLYKMFLKTKKEARILRTLNTIHHNFSEHLDIPTLARDEDMSVSSFHTYFKQVTSHTPLQYIKKIRLYKAKELIAKENYQVNDTAFEVGYENISQFSRDFKSYFGYPPKEAKPSFEEHSLV